MRLIPVIKAALDATGLPYTAEMGGKHLKVRLAGKIVGVLNHGGKNGNRTIKNVIANIKRVAREA